MKNIQEQKAEKVTKIAELVIEMAEATAKAINHNLPDEERRLNAIKAIMIDEVELPLVIHQPIMTREYPNGGIAVVRERGTETFIPPTRNK